MTEPTPPTPPTEKLRGAVTDAVWPLKEAAWSVQEKLLWPAGDRLRSRKLLSRKEKVTDEKADSRSGLFGRETLYPIERAWWGVERSVVWPVQDRFVELGQNAQVAVVGAVAATAIAAGAAGFVSGGTGTAPTPNRQAPAANQIAAVHEQPKQVAFTLGTPIYPAGPAAESEATLKGVTPDFGATASLKAINSPDAAGTGDATPVNARQAPPLPTNGKTPEEPAAFPAAPGTGNAQEVASHFSNAFVQYEVGDHNPAVKQAFHETATPALAKSLAERPPRLPGEIVVPQAKVLNILIGKPDGKQVEASVSLVRLGSLSELRLILRKEGKSWLISEVRG